MLFSRSSLTHILLHVNLKPNSQKHRPEFSNKEEYPANVFTVGHIFTTSILDSMFLWIYHLVLPDTHFIDIYFQLTVWALSALLFPASMCGTKWEYVLCLLLMALNNRLMRKCGWNNFKFQQVLIQRNINQFPMAWKRICNSFMPNIK